MTQQINGMPEFNYSEETFREMYEALRKVRVNIGHIIMTKADASLVDEIDQALAKAEGKEG